MRNLEAQETVAKQKTTGESMQESGATQEMTDKSGQENDVIQERKECMKMLCAKMEKILDKKRFQHTLSVAGTASCMAMRFGCDPYMAYIAGLLHDNAKCLSDEKKLSLCDKYGISVNKAEKSNPDLLHAKLGSYLAEKKYGIHDAQILSAITYHTTGKPGMTDLEKIIYIADYIEIYRKTLPRMEEARRLAFMDLDRCMLCILESTLSFLQHKNASIDSITLETYDYYKQVVANKETK